MRRPSAAILTLLLWAAATAGPADDSSPMDTLLLKDYKPRSTLVVPETAVARARFPAIDVHTHSMFDVKTEADVDAWVRTLDEVGVETVIVTTDATGADFDRQVALFAKYPKRFRLYCSFDYSDIDAPGYSERVVRELVRCYRLGARGVGEISDKGWGLESGIQAWLATKSTNGNRTGPPQSKRLHVDDPRLDALWEKCADLKLPVSIHIADHPSCWLPLGPSQERPPQFAHMNQYGKDVPSYEEMIERLDRMLARHPRTTVIACHLRNQGNDLAAVARALDRHPNLYVDIAARDYELGREPRFAARFMERYKNRILFGTDYAQNKQMYQAWWRFLEATDDYLPGPTGWRIYALGLPDNVLRAVYRENAQRVLNWQ